MTEFNERLIEKIKSESKHASYKDIQKKRNAWNEISAYLGKPVGNFPPSNVLDFTAHDSAQNVITLNCEIEDMNTEVPNQSMSDESPDNSRTSPVNGTVESACSPASKSKNTRKKADYQWMQSEEWDIRYDDIQKGDKIGSGRVGTVYSGYWHADVAIRVIDININDEEKIKAFKQEINVFKKTRHENLELFMGACMNPPHLAIVTGFCQGASLYTCIRDNKLQTKENQIKIIAQHIVQGMGYLHSKGIVHKDLKSKNIFVHKKRVVITGFGLVGLHAVAWDNSRKLPGCLKIPDGWLCYLAPELIRSLRVPFSASDDVVSTLPYTNMTDVFAFGTVWYELLVGSWPNQGLNSERIIWQVGSDKKYGLTNVHSQKELKDIVVQCWSFDADQRPGFSKNGLLSMLEKLPTHMQRSMSSHPRRTPNRNSPIERMYEGSHLRHTPLSTLHGLAE